MPVDKFGFYLMGFNRVASSGGKLVLRKACSANKYLNILLNLSEFRQADPVVHVNLAWLTR